MPHGDGGSGYIFGSISSNQNFGYLGLPDNNGNGGHYFSTIANVAEVGKILAGGGLVGKSGTYRPLNNTAAGYCRLYYIGQ
jgi:hypothetical protein